MIFENILKRFVADLIPKLLPDLLREIAASIEQGGVAQITPEQVRTMLENHDTVIRETAAEMSS
jgi:hypothetical protein